MPDPGPYRTLQADKIVETVAHLERRIHERFPDSGLVRVAAELHQIAQVGRPGSADPATKHRPADRDRAADVAAGDCARDADQPVAL